MAHTPEAIGCKVKVDGATERYRSHSAERVDREGEINAVFEIPGAEPTSFALRLSST